MVTESSGWQSPLPKFTVTFTQPELGTVKAQLDGKPFTGGEVEKGKVIEFSADIPSGCRIKQWHGTDIPAQTNTLAMLTVSAAVTVSVDLEYTDMVDPSFLVISNGILINCRVTAKGVVKIPSTVTAINNGTFFGREHLTGIIIPDSVIGIGSRAFEKCKRLTAISIPDSVTYMQQAAFCECENLTTIRLPKGITKIEKKLFQDCTKLKTLNWGELQVQEVGEYAFADCDIRDTVVLPKVKMIHRNAFAGNRELRSIKITSENITMKGLVFYGCNKLEKLIITSKSCSFDFRPDSDNEQSLRLFVYEGRIIKDGGFQWERKGFVPSSLQVVVKYESVKNKLVSEGGIPAEKITVDPNVE